MSKARQLAGQLQGVVGVMNTPFTAEDTIDTDSIRRYIDHYIDRGVAALLITAMASEVEKLSLHERLLITRTAVEQAAGRVPVIAGVAASSQHERLHYAEKYCELGCDGLMVSIPFQQDRVFVNQVTEISHNMDGLLMLQDWNFDNMGIPLPTILELYNTLDNFECLKVEVKPAGVKYSQVIEATRGKLNVSGGWASSQMIEGLDRGVNAFMSTIMPDVYKYIYDTYHTGNRQKALEIFNKIVPLLAFSHQHIDISVHFNKRFVHAQKLFSGAAVRQPILSFDAYHQRIGRELIQLGLEVSAEVLARLK